MRKIVLTLALLLLGIGLLGTSVSAQDSDSFTMPRFTVNGKSPTALLPEDQDFWGICPEGILAMLNNTINEQDTEFKLTRNEAGYAFDLFLYDLLENGALGDMTDHGTSEENLGNSQSLKFDVPAKTAVCVEFFKNGESSDEAANGTVSASGANIRSCPSTRCAAVGKVANGTALNITGKTADGIWLQVDGKNWIHSSLVNVTNITNITVVHNVTVPTPSGGSGGGGGSNVVLSDFCSNKVAFVFDSLAAIDGMEICPNQGSYIIVDPWLANPLTTSVGTRIPVANAASAKAWLSGAGFNRGSIWFAPS
jgi:hypothetical protein